jgi:hypothetical protein
MIVKCWKVLRLARPRIFRPRPVTSEAVATVVRRRPRPGRWALVCVTVGAPAGGAAIYGGMAALPALPGGAPAEPVPAWVAERIASAGVAGPVDAAAPVAVSEPAAAAILLVALAFLALARRSA